MTIVPLTENHFDEVSAIYAEGLKTGIATFETSIPNWTEWNSKFLPFCRYVVISNGIVLAWCALSAVSKRHVYRGVSESTIYVKNSHNGKGIGTLLLNYLITQSEEQGIWTLQASIFAENKPSLQLHENCGFRIVGIREKIAQRNGKWYDNILLERRNKIR